MLLKFKNIKWDRLCQTKANPSLTPSVLNLGFDLALVLILVHKFKKTIMLIDFERIWGFWYFRTPSNREKILLSCLKEANWQKVHFAPPQLFFYFLPHFSASFELFPRGVYIKGEKGGGKTFFWPITPGISWIKNSWRLFCKIFWWSNYERLP